MDSETKRKMLELARKAIINARDEAEFKKLLDDRIVDMKGGVFVSVYVDDELRGCIGNLNAVDIHRGIIKNAVMAAFYDNRFPPVEPEEFSRMKVHINILGEPEELRFKDSNDLLAKLDRRKGVIIEKGFKKATFLPSVWKELKDKREFLEHLCLKAGLSQDEWTTKGIKVFLYDSEEFSE